MQTPSSSRVLAAGLALAAALLWSTYYLFILGVRSVAAPSAVLLYPFVAGGVAYAAWAVAQGHGRRLLPEFAVPVAYGRAGLLITMQVSTIVATYLIGPVDASLLSLLGDVVATPLVVAALFAVHRGEVGNRGFVVGLVLSVAGGTLAIVGGHGLAAVHGIAWAVVGVLPIAIPFYFILCSRAGATTPISVVVAQATLAAAGISLVLSPLLPGGIGALATVPAWAAALLAVNGVISFWVAPLLYFRAIRLAGLALPPMMMTGIPVFTLLLSAVVLGIPPALLGLLGVPVAVVGGVIALAAGAREGTET